MPNTLILLGAGKTGKTTVGRLLADALQTSFCDLPAKSRECWQEAGFDGKEFQRISQEEGIAGVRKYFGPFEVGTLERGVREHPGSVLKVSPEQAVQEEPELVRRVADALAPLENVFLLMPTPDVDESERMLQEQSAGEQIEGRDFVDHFLRHHSNSDLAKFTVYTKGRTPQESCDEILARHTPGESIILIGPMGTGKSTLGRLLAERLGVPSVPLDDRRWDYYKEIGWSEEEQNRIGKAEGFAGVYRYWKPFELHSLGRVLEDTPPVAVIDLGAGHSVYEDDAQFARAQELLAPYANVVLVLPSSDLEESSAILRERGGSFRNGMSADRFFLLRLTESGLAKHTVYTAGKTPEQTRDEILSLYRASV